MATSGTSYTQGSIFGHVSTLSITSAIGLFAIFAVDLVDVFFIAMLGQPELAAAVGFAGTALFFGVAICIGLSIATSTVVAQAMGAGQKPEATRLATHGLLFSLLLTIPLTLLALWFADVLIGLMGAEGHTLQLAVHYFRIVGALFLLRNVLVDIFALRDEAAALLQFYCTFIVITYWLYGLQLAANPLFTALRHPGYATLSNLLRDLCLGIPLIYAGSQWFGAPGVLVGQALGNMVAGIVAFSVALWLSRRVERGLSIDLPFTIGTQRWHFYRALAPGVQHRGH